jgi:protoheme IX farnesyltransferase
MMIKTLESEKEVSLKAKLGDYSQLIKFRLSFLVVFSSMIAYIYAGGIILPFWKALFLILGGFLVTGSANSINQLMERDLDKLMDRTKSRPLPSRRMSSLEAISASFFMGSMGLTLLYLINPLTSIMGALALILYAFVYTPMKQVTPFSVFMGAIPGALSPVLGYTAATGLLSFEPGVFFLIQFVWQFPHFWAIAWVVDDDYARAGFHLLPSEGGRDRNSAIWIFATALILIPISLLPFYTHMGGYFYAISALVFGLFFLYQSVNLLFTCSVKSAQRLMFASFFYLPLVQLALLINKLF